MATVIGDIALVLGASSVLGALARRLGQPTVIGQITAGIILGPSLLGRLPGDSTSITALPVLAAIVRERGMAGTPAGDIATAAAGLVLATALIRTKAAGSTPWLETG